MALADDGVVVGGVADDQVAVVDAVHDQVVDDPAVGAHSIEYCAWPGSRAAGR